MTTKDEVQALMHALLAEAKQSRKWLWNRLYDLWFSPNELIAAQADGKFCWGPSNWQLRDPRERIRELEENVRSARNELNEFTRRYMNQ